MPEYGIIFNDLQSKINAVFRARIEKGGFFADLVARQQVKDE